MYSNIKQIKDDKSNTQVDKPYSNKYKLVIHSNKLFIMDIQTLT